MSAKRYNFFEIVVRTPKGLVSRYYKKPTLGEAQRAARNKSDCLEIVKTSEISEDGYNKLVAMSDQKKISYSAAFRVCHQKEKARMLQRH